MTRRQVIYTAGAVLSAAGFLAYRGLGSAPAPAAAEQPAAASVARSSQKKPVAPNGAHSGVEDPSLAYLENMSDAWPRRDVFKPSGGMLLHYQQLIESGQDVGQEASPAPPQTFTAQHRLEATFHGADGAMAMVSGRLLRVGDALGEFRLAAIEPRRVEFRRGDERAFLSIPTAIE